MKAVLPYTATSSVRRILGGVDESLLQIALVEDADTVGLERELADADILLHVLSPVTEATFGMAPKLRLVQKIGVGVDTIDREAARRLGVAVCNMPGTNTNAVAEHALSLMFACLRRVVPIDNDMRDGRGWPARSDNVDAVGEIQGSCVGLIGYGAVARRLTPILRALGATVIAHARDPTIREVEIVPLDQLLARADIVSLHLPLTEATRNLLDAHRLAQMKPGAIVINTARGPLIDEAALANALREGRLSAAGLDVFAQEPASADNPLFGLRNVVVSPHVAWMTTGTWKRSVEVIVENARRLSAGEPLLHRVS